MRTGWMVAVASLAMLVRRSGAEECLGKGAMEGCTALDPRGREAEEAAQAAVDALKKMSEAGTYETLFIKRVTSVSAGLGRFHENIVIDCDLASEVVIAGQPQLEWKTEFVVMRDPKTKVVRSVSVDKLPEFPKAVTESFNARKTRERIAERERTFRQLEMDFAQEQATFLELALSSHDSEKTLTEILNDLKSLPDATLRDVRDKATGTLREIVDGMISLSSSCAA